MTTRSSAREYAVLYLDRNRRSSTSRGGNAVLTAGRHKLDGAEHLAADDTVRLDASVDEHGLLPKLSGDSLEYLSGDGLFIRPALSELRDVSVYDLADGDGVFWDETSGLWLPGPGGGAGESEAELTGVDIVIDGGGAPITSGIKGYFRVPFTGSITGWRLVGDQAGDVVIDLWAGAYVDETPPTVADTITASAKPTLSSEQTAEDSTLTGWSPSVTLGDVIAVYVDSASTLQRVTLSIAFSRPGPAPVPGGGVWRGAWDSGTAYVVGDVVEDGGSSYIATADSTNQEPPNASYWDLVASKGDTGSTGSTGAGVPTGGDTGQVLAKASGTDYDTEWADQTGGSSDDPVADVFGTPSSAGYEFNGSDLASFTALATAADVADEDTTAPGHLFIQRNATATYRWVGYYVTPPSAPFTAIAKLSGIPAANYNKAALFVGEATPGNMDLLSLIWNGSLKLALERDSQVAFGSTVATGTVPPANTMYFAIRANSSTSFDYLYSFDGRIWRALTTARNPSLTIASVGLGANPDGTGALMAGVFGYLRIWNSAKSFPGV